MANSLSVSPSVRLPGPVPEGFNPANFFRDGYWHQRWEIFKGIYTPGHNSVADLMDRAGVPQDLNGQRVLDVGAWHGCFSFECERRGAREVIALSLEDPDQTDFWRLHGALGSTSVRYRRESIYAADTRTLGQFDVILFFGVLYHLRYPLLAIDKLRLLSRGRVFIETHVIDDRPPVGTSRWTQASRRCLRFLHRGLGKLRLASQDPDRTGRNSLPYWRFYKEGELNSDPTNIFGPNVRAVLDAFASAGFDTACTSRWADRATFTARVRNDLAQALEKTYEGEQLKGGRLQLA